MNRQSNVGIYARLSVDDVRNSKRIAAVGQDSMSISNQLEMLSAYARNQGWREVKRYFDDGVSGSHQNRPAFQEMLRDAENGVINLILVSDLSRFGRNYIEVGQYTDFILPSIGCRLVTVHDGIDTGRDDNEIMPFRALLNDRYLKDLSDKIKASHRLMAREGKRVSGRPPYGYKADPSDRHNFLIDDYAAEIVRRIYKMRFDGKGYGKIAKALNDEGVLCPREYEFRIIKGGENPFPRDSVWTSCSTKRVLHSEAYIGNRVQCKSAPVSYCISQSKIKPEEEWIRVENTHPAIIDRELWDAVQEINRAASEKYTAEPKQSSLFRGLLRCSDCGSALACTHVKHKSPKPGKVIHYINYECARYSQSGASGCVSHRISESELKQLLLEDIRTQAEAITLDRDRMRNMLLQQLDCNSSSDCSSAVSDRLTELERISACLYEDKVAGVITAETFRRLLRDYETEREALESQLEALESAKDERDQIFNDVEQWLDVVTRHSEVTEVDRNLLEELVERVEVSAKNSGDAREIKIYYRFVGTIATA